MTKSMADTIEERIKKIPTSNGSTVGLTMDSGLIRYIALEAAEAARNFLFREET